MRGPWPPADDTVPGPPGDRARATVGVLGQWPCLRPPPLPGPGPGLGGAAPPGPLLISMTMAVFFEAMPLGLVSATVPAGQFEATWPPVTGVKPAFFSSAWASPTAVQATAGTGTMSPSAIFESPGLGNWTPGLPFMKSATVFHTAGLTWLCDMC